MNLPEQFVVAIDGPAGSGKSTMAKLLAQKIGATVIDSGAMYRAVTLEMLEQNLDPADEDKAGQVAQNISISLKTKGGASKVIADGKDVSTKIRTHKVSEKVSIVAAYPGVREALLVMQRKMGEEGRVVMEGRDIGSHVFPSARYKFFLVAKTGERAKRRAEELGEAGSKVSVEEVEKNLIERDQIDSSRKAAPLIKPVGAIEIDTTDLSIDEALGKMIENMLP